MRDRLRYIALSARVLLREDAWVFIIPALILIITGAWTHYFVEPGGWDPSTGLLQAEMLGPLLAAFLCAGLLTPEQRRGASEVVFTKPHSPAVLLGTRLVLAMVAVLALILGLLLSYQLRHGNALVGKAMLFSVPPCLFIGMVAVTAGQFGRSAVTGFAVPLAFWFWDSTLGMLVNPLFILQTGWLASVDPQGADIPTSLFASKSAMLLTAGVLFWINLRAIRRTQAG